MRFRFEDYKGDYIMWCKTEEEAKDFCRVMHENMRAWKGGAYYIDETNYGKYGDRTCYAFNMGEFCYIDFYKKNGYTILKWEDFMEKEFTLSDLKVGMLIENKEGEKFIIAETIDGRLIGTNETGFTELKNYNDDMTFMRKDYEYRFYDIVKVYSKRRRGVNMYGCDTDYRDLLFQRKEPKELTMQEIADRFNIPVDQLKIKK